MPLMQMCTEQNQRAVDLERQGLPTELPEHRGPLVAMQIDASNKARAPPSAAPEASPESSALIDPPVEATSSAIEWVPRCEKGAAPSFRRFQSGIKLFSGIGKPPAGSGSLHHCCSSGSSGSVGSSSVCFSAPTHAQRADMGEAGGGERPISATLPIVAVERHWRICASS